MTRLNLTFLSCLRDTGQAVQLGEAWKSPKNKNEHNIIKSVKDQMKCNLSLSFCNLAAEGLRG